MKRKMGFFPSIHAEPSLQVEPPQSEISESQHIKFFRDSDRYTVLDPRSGSRVSLTREELKSLAREILVELNVKELVLHDGKRLHETDQKWKDLYFKRWGQNL